MNTREIIRLTYNEVVDYIDFKDIRVNRSSSKIADSWHYRCRRCNTYLSPAHPECKHNCRRQAIEKWVINLSRPVIIDEKDIYLTFDEVKSSIDPGKVYVENNIAFFPCGRCRTHISPAYPDCKHRCTRSGEPRLMTTGISKDWEKQRLGYYLKKPEDYMDFFNLDFTTEDVVKRAKDRNIQH